MLEKANKIRIFNAMKNKWYVYEYINKFPGITVYDLAKKINWSVGKTKYYLQKLVEDNVINNSSEIVNGRSQKRYSPVDYKELIKLEELDSLE